MIYLYVLYIAAAQHANSDVKCFSKDEEANEASKDDDSAKISAEEINDSDKVSLPIQDVDQTEVVHRKSNLNRMSLFVNWNI